MRVRVNGEEKVVPDGLTVRALLDHLGLVEGPVAVERNREVVTRAEHATTKLAEGDEIEIVHFVGGGLRAGVPNGCRTDRLAALK